MTDLRRRPISQSALLGPHQPDLRRSPPASNRSAAYQGNFGFIID